MYSGKKRILLISIFYLFFPTYSTVRVVNISRIEVVGNKTHGITLAVKGIINLLIVVVFK